MSAEKIKTGIEGLDEMLNWGIPKDYVVTLLGASGTGKTIAALQFTYSCLQQNLSCLYISTSQSVESLLNTANFFGWDFKKYLETEQLLFRYFLPVRIEPIPTQRPLSSGQEHSLQYKITIISDYLEELPAALAENVADAVVID